MMGNWMGNCLGWGGGYGFMGGFGFLFTLIFWILVVWAVVAVVRSLSHNGGHYGERREDAAMRMLRERYAKGEITKEQFEQTKKDLGA